MPQKKQQAENSCNKDVWKEKVEIRLTQGYLNQQGIDVTCYIAKCERRFSSLVKARLEFL